MTFHHDRRNAGTWGYGWSSDHGWLMVSGWDGTVYLDVWHWRIRWTGHNYRPLFSERYGYANWHHLGRLAFHYAKPQRDQYATANRESK